MCFGPSEINQQFSRQQSGAYDNTQNFSDRSMDLYNRLQGYIDDKYDRQSGVHNTLTRTLTRAVGKLGGPDKLQGRWWELGGGAGGGNGSGGAGGGGRSGSGGGSGDAFSSLDLNPGFLESDYTLNFPARGYNRLRNAMQGNATEQVVDQFKDAREATMQNLHVRGLGGDDALAAELNAKNDWARSADQSKALRDVDVFIGEKKAEDSRLAAQLNTQLGIAKGDARFKSAAMMNEAQMQIAKARQAASQAAAARAAAGRAANAANRSADQRFAAQMRLAGAELNSNNFFRSIGALGALGENMNPQNYIQQALGSIGQGSSNWGNIYNTGSRGMVETQPRGGWGQLLGGAIGSLGGLFTGGASLGLGSLFGGGGPSGHDVYGTGYFGGGT